MCVCRLQQKPQSAEQIEDGTGQAAMVAVMQKSSPGVVASRQLNMTQQHPVPEKKPQRCYGMDELECNL